MSIPKGTKYLTSTSKTTTSAEVLADSISTEGRRLTTFVVNFPRDVLPELLTHRVFSRNSASGRAIPVAKVIKQVLENPYISPYVGKNQAGMQAGKRLSDEEYAVFYEEELIRRNRAVYGAYEMLLGGAKVRAISSDPENPDFDALAEAWKDGDKGEMLNIHKQHVNRQLHHWQWNPTIISATEWSNFFALRNHDAADPAIHELARVMQEAYKQSAPKALANDEWHAPFLTEEELFALNVEEDTSMLDVSAARSARISYLTHDGKRDHEADITLAHRLKDGHHMSPFEHVAHPSGDQEFHGNFRGWLQYRKYFAGESDYSASL